MIEANTLFILGAGASVPYGLPTGQQLREQICGLLRTPSTPLDLLRGVYGYSDEAIGEFVDAFLQSGLQSIDSFLARRADCEEIGKAAIAACLLQSEQAWKLRAVDGVPGRSDWYGELWNRMMDGVEKPEQLLEGNYVRVATFNYDRSLEAFLHGAVKATFKMNDVTAQEIWSQLPIHHIYGSLGDFGEENSFQYGLPEPEAVLRRIAQAAVHSIKVMPLARHGEQDSLVAKNAAWAERVLILGFSFDPINCARLGIAPVAAARTKGSLVPKVYATRRGLTDAEADVAKRWLLQDKCSVEAGWRMLPTDCLGALREWGLLIT